MTDGLLPFFVLAVATTALCDAGVATSWLAGREPPGWALPLAGLGAFGPTIAAVLVSARAGDARAPLRLGRSAPGWVALALLLPLVLRLPASLLTAALEGPPARWVLLPAKPENWVAFVVFALGEEPGWRGFAHPRVVARWGPTLGPTLLGLGWAAWHAPMMVLPDGRIDWLSWGMLFAMFPPYSVLFGRVLERGGGGLALAFALHAGGHLDNVNAAPPDALAMRALYVVTLWAAVALVPPRAPAG